MIHDNSKFFYSCLLCFSCSYSATLVLYDIYHAILDQRLSVHLKICIDIQSSFDSLDLPFSIILFWFCFILGGCRKYTIYYSCFIVNCKLVYGFDL